MKSRNPPPTPAIPSGDTPVSPEAESGASGADSRQEKALLAIFRHLTPAYKHKLMRKARSLREEDIRRLFFLMKK